MKTDRNRGRERLIARARSQPICRHVLRLRYAQAGERSVDDVLRRVARALAARELPEERTDWTRQFLKAMRQGFIPAGRILACAGTANPRGMINCFVLPLRPPDVDLNSRKDGADPLDASLRDAVRTMRSGGGVGYDFSFLPSFSPPGAGDAVRRTDPIGVILELDRRALRLSNLGPRRAAQMAVLRVDHPDIHAFIAAKRLHRISTFNLSVAISDQFMEAVRADVDWKLVEPGRTHACQTLRARALWESLIESMWNTASPGVIFIDQVNRDNNLGTRETLSACNPCGEQYLPEYGACDLGSIDLVRLVRNPFSRTARIDFERLAALAAIAVRMLDNVLDLTRWPLARQAQQAASTRRIGLGLTGLADALCMMGLRYDRIGGRRMAQRIVCTMRNAAYRASADLAMERGRFPNFDEIGFLQAGRAASRLPLRLQKRIRQSGLRNSHLLAIAPAGSISIAFAANATSGIEPAFAPHMIRRLGSRGGAITALPSDNLAIRLYRALYPHRKGLPPAWCDASGMRAVDHIRMLAAVQPYVDGAISKTVNLGGQDTQASLGYALELAWKRGLKGLAVFRPHSSGRAVLSQQAAPGCTA